ncbi:MAG: FkbM family methyltransferase [Helicobacter sp.]|uniref:FkbM family methyltransferase n=1 Tax=Helicobacter sp. TaxID=218 RepID=UPI0023C6D8E6|nr:FkbM family methyltransferase [Helicobacter sp.]MDE7174551.1 FkbM family methyltransferase [Helicobacter sp.]
MIDKNIIDVGGYIGDSALILQQYTQKKVYSFEALSDNYDLMRQTIALNNANRIIPIKKALGAKFEKVKIARYGAGSSIVVHHNQDFEEAEVITLDSFVQEHNAVFAGCARDNKISKNHNACEYLSSSK